MLTASFRSIYRLLLAATLACAGAGAAHAQSGQDIGQKIRSLPWVVSPAAGSISNKATVDLQGMRFLDPEGASRFLEITGNLPRSDAYVLGRNDLGWWAVLHFLPEGYVKDDERIDQAELLKILKEGNARAAEERRKRGLPALTLEGWQLPPQYDREYKRLEWATLLRDAHGNRIVNYTTKLLGRSGYTSATLVSEPGSFSSDVAEFKQALRKVEYVPGERYSEWKPGDKVAAYGLGALVVGGAAAVATKKGFWALLGTMIAGGWKVLVGLGVAALAWVRNLFKRKSA